MFSLDPLLRLFAPLECLVCYQEGDLLCGFCQKTAVQALSSCCYRCMALTTNGAVCPACKPHTIVQHAWVVTEHSEAARELVRALKFARAQSAARVMASMMHQLLPPFPPGAVVTPIPTAPARVRERGYDQAELIARRLAKLRKLPYKKLLQRQGNTRQVGASRAQRHTQLQAAFRVRSATLPSSIVLVDDVVTTGATIEAAAQAFQKSGALHINAALFAQRLKNTGS